MARFKECAPIAGTLNGKELNDPRLSFVAARTNYSMGTAEEFYADQKTAGALIVKIPLQQGIPVNFSKRITG